MKFSVIGGRRLSGEIPVQGAKNSILPILAACVLCRGEVVLHNCPDLSDVSAAAKILSHLGLSVTREGSTLSIFSGGITGCDVPEELMREMRSSVVFLGAILSEAGCARISMPGGCELGPRPIDMHISAIKKLGALSSDLHGTLCFTTPNGLVGTHISLWFPSVGATENIILASVKAKGTTVITNAAREPEIVDLARFLNSCGARIIGAGSSTVVIEGVSHLTSCEYKVMPDRIAAVTFLTASAMTGGEILLGGAVKDDITSVLSPLEQTGCEISCKDDTVFLKAPKRLSAMHIIKTMPHPGFPTDAQAPIMALSTLCEGSTMFVETIFENRYRHVGELLRMGADIKTEGKVAVVNGVKSLHGAHVTSTDLRGGAALLLAALSAEGESIISDIEHIDRGYQHIENDLNLLGAEVVRLK